MSAARPGKNLFEIKCPAPVQRTLIKNGEFVESELGFRSTEHYWRCRCATAAGVTGAYGINLAPSKERPQRGLRIEVHFCTICLERKLALRVVSLKQWQ
jgi:hypothetical protein